MFRSCSLDTGRVHGYIRSDNQRCVEANNIKSPAPPLGSDVLLDTFAGMGTTRVFLLPGAHIDPFVAAAARHAHISPIVCATESGAAFMADGYARLSNTPGFCAGIGAAGASNMITGAVTARFDRSPVCFMTGDVPLHLDGLGGFQDGSEDGTRDNRLFDAAIDATHTIEHSGDLRPVLDHIVDRLTVERRPVHLRIRHDVLAGVVETAGELRDVQPAPGSYESEDQSGAWEQRILASHRIAVLAGDRMDSDTCDRLIGLARRLAWPVATTLSAKGLLPEDDDLSLGNFGYGGAQRATRVLLHEEIDLLLVIGVDLNERNSLCWHPHLTPQGRQLLLVDSLPRAYMRDPSVEIFTGEAAGLLIRVEQKADTAPDLPELILQRRRWLADFHTIARLYPHPSGWDDEVPVHPGRLVHEMRQALPRKTMLFLDSGAHRLFAGHYWQAYGQQLFHTAATTAPMGWAISAAIGAKLAQPDAPIVVLTGDGCMRMQGMELATAKRYGANIVVVVSDNGVLGSVYRRQENNGPEVADHCVLPDIDWLTFCLSMGVNVFPAATLAELSEVLPQALSADGPALVAVKTQANPQIPDIEQSTSACSVIPHTNLAHD